MAYSALVLLCDRFPGFALNLPICWVKVVSCLNNVNNGKFAKHNLYQSTYMLQIV